MARLRRRLRARSAPGARRAAPPLRCAARVLIVASLLAGPTASAHAQTDGTFVGAIVGGAETSQVWRPEAETDAVRGLIAGAFVDVATSLAGLRLRAEGAYTQRGGDVVLESGGQPVRGGVRAQYLSVGLQLLLTRTLGPVRVHVAGGPTLDQTLSSRLDPVLAQILEEESAVIFAVSLGTGVGAWVSERLFLGLDLRLTEGLGDAYSGGFTGFHNRSVEAVLRAGVPVAWLRSRS